MKPLDRNGHEINENDCVRIIAAECNKVIDRELKHICPLIVPMLRQSKDSYGIANLDQGLKITDIDGNVIWNAIITLDRPEPCLEVVPMHIQTIDGKKFLVADTMSTAFTAWFGEEIGNELINLLKGSEPERSVVYILRMSNNTTKIGVAKDFHRRKNTISNSSGLDVIQWAHTATLPAREAYTIESTCHKAFHDKLIKGEFFNISFKEACAELQKHSKIIKRFKGF